MISKGLAQNEYSELRTMFVSKLLKMLEDFYDFKIAGDKFLAMRSDFFCKLVSKHIVLLLEVPAPDLMTELVDLQGYVEVRYRRFELS